MVVEKKFTSPQKKVPKGASHYKCNECKTTTLASYDHEIHAGVGWSVVSKVINVTIDQDADDYHRNANHCCAFAHLYCKGCRMKIGAKLMDVTDPNVIIKVGHCLLYTNSLMFNDGAGDTPIEQHRQDLVLLIDHGDGAACHPNSSGASTSLSGGSNSASTSGN